MTKFFYLKTPNGRYYNTRLLKQHPMQHRGTAFESLEDADDAWRRMLRDARKSIKYKENEIKNTVQTIFKNTFSWLSYVDA